MRAPTARLANVVRWVAAIGAFTSGCAMMQVPAPLQAVAPVEVDGARESGVVGPFTYELAWDGKFFRDRTDLREAWDFGVTFEGRALGSGTCRHGLHWPGQAVGDPPERSRDLGRSVECTLSSMTSTAPIALSLRPGGPGEELVGWVRRGADRIAVRASHEMEGGLFLTGRRMGFVLERGGVPWAAIQTVNDRRAWIPPLEPDTQDLLGLVIVALATIQPFTEEILTP